MTAAPDPHALATARLDQTRAVMAQQDVDAVLVGASTDLRWLVGYNAHAMERLTLLVLPREGRPQLVVPGLEEPSAKAAGADAHADLRPWGETEDPIALVASILAEAGAPADATLAVQDHLHSAFLIRLQRVLPDADWMVGSDLLRLVRQVKQPDEVAALRAAGAAIDRVHERIPQVLRAGRTEAEVGRDIKAMILEEHDTAEFIIVASGPNGASPHHETGDRVIQRGDAVVVDIGGRKDGYCSDCTRNYVVGEVPEGYAEMYADLLRSQEAGVAAGVVGNQAQDVDRAARGVLDEAGWGEWFTHRTGHGIGVDVHEHPYMVEGNTDVIEAGMAFSVEPGVYVPGKWGARIEDIVVASDAGPIRCNNTTRDFVVVDA